jgi:large subunit ribosomal protein L22
MSKKKLIKETKNKMVKSINKNVKKVDIAIRNLTFSDKRISHDIKKTISSAVANAENNFQYDIDKLIVKEAYCGKKVVMKRFRPRAKGRAAPILKPYSSVTIILSEQKKVENYGTKS